VFDYSIDTATAYASDGHYHIGNAEFGAAQLQLSLYARKRGFHVDADDLLIPGGPLCHALKLEGYSIWPDGKVTRCVHEVDTPENVSLAAGSIHADQAPSLKRWVIDEVFDEEPCRSCFYLPICGGSCVHSRYQGLKPPEACPPSKHTIKDRMRAYDAIIDGRGTQLEVDRDQLAMRLAALST